MHRRTDLKWWDNIMRTAKVVLLICVYCTTAVFSQISSTPRPQMWVTNGPVYAIAATADKVYIGGNFTSVGPSDGSSSITRNHLACFDVNTGAVNAGSLMRTALYIRSQ